MAVSIRVLVEHDAGPVEVLAFKTPLEAAAFVAEVESSPRRGRRRITVWVDGESVYVRRATPHGWQDEPGAYATRRSTR